MSELPLLIYLPGMEGTGKLFYRQEPSLAPHYKVVCLGSRTELPFGYDDLIQDALAEMDKAGAAKATIVAESFGGTVALQLAIRHPERIERMILVNSFPYFRRRIRIRLALWLLPLTFIPIGNAIREFFYKVALASEGVAREDIRRLCECSFSAGHRVSRRRLELIRNLDVRDQMKNVPVPITLVAAKRDKLIPSIQEATFMASLLPNAQVVVLPKHGHSVLLNQDFSLSDLLIPHLRRQE